MPEFRKKPVIIEARQWTGEDLGGLRKWSDNKIRYGGASPEEYLLIETLEGTMTCAMHDWIIRGVKGEFYPCKPDIFAQTYEPADAPAPKPDIGQLTMGDFADFFGCDPSDAMDAIELMKAAARSKRDDDEPCDCAVCKERRARCDCRVCSGEKAKLTKLN